mmetsp:Transcript_8369/g.18372  ORF Transcript_8369/g.18372 Transcript_8369/m.18372 type:complete len:324 (-) Transcript_8369:215-1186(-)
MVQLQMTISSASVTQLITHACERAKFEVALQIIDDILMLGMNPSINHFLPLLRTSGSFSRAKSVLQRMEYAGLEINVISYTAAIKSCENKGDWRSALELLDLMRTVGILPNKITYCVISVASRGCKGDVAANLREMEHCGVPRNQLCYGSALPALGAICGPRCRYVMLLSRCCCRTCRARAYPCRRASSTPSSPHHRHAAKPPCCGPHAPRPAPRTATPRTRTSPNQQAALDASRPQQHSECDQASAHRGRRAAADLGAHPAAHRRVGTRGGGRYAESVQHGDGRAGGVREGRGGDGAVRGAGCVRSKAFQVLLQVRHAGLRL